MRLTLLPQTPHAWRTVKIGCATTVAWWLVLASLCGGDATSTLATLAFLVAAALTFPLGWVSFAFVNFGALGWALDVVSTEVMLILMPLTMGLVQWANCHLWASVWEWAARRLRRTPAHDAPGVGGTV